MKNDLINQMRQNRPSLVVDDLTPEIFSEYPECDAVSRNSTYSVLLNRGVFKWLSVRRRLICLKLGWKTEISNTLDEIEDIKTTIRMFKESPRIGKLHKRLHELRGYLKALNKCRQEVRELCHSPRLQCPDNDSRAREWFRGARRNGR